MIAGRQVSWFSVALAVVALGVAGEGWVLFSRVQAARKAQTKLVQKRRELASVSSLEPAPTAINATAIEADLARTTRALDAMRASLRGRGPAAEALRRAPVPERRPDAYFDIATFVEAMRAAAQRQGVTVKTDERFGFAEYAHAGPETELIPAVFRERLIVQHLLENLFEARPRQLLSVQRERPVAPAEVAARADKSTQRNNAESGAGEDYFEIDPRVSARVPGFVDATAFRFSFIGPTSTLRTWLNRLAGFELPLVVRGVEVEPAPASAEDRTDSANAATPGAEPLIRRTLSRFTVTVEFVDLVERKE